MRKVILAAAFLAAGCFGAAAADIGGTYDVQGTNLDGSEYSGTATITVTTKNTCRIEWVTGGTTSSGICMRNGSAFSAAYVLGKDIGLVIYGSWTTARSTACGPSPTLKASAPRR